jgi:molecular chaperone DnaK
MWAYDEPVYGIDLGTTYSAITYVHPRTGEVQDLIRLEERDFTLPSAVLFMPGGRVRVGRSAIENSFQPNTLLAVFAKRTIGLMKDAQVWHFEGQDYYPEDVSALILRRIAQVVPDFNLPPVRRVVVTHPQYFWSNQKEATREACLLAGLEPLATLTEPHAAAIAYGAYETARREGRDLNVLIFDLGGGTLDITVMHLSPTVMEVLASHGDSRLGGIDWDRVLIDWVKEYFRNQTGEDPDVVMMPEQAVALQVQVEEVKRRLSNTDQSRLIVKIGRHRPFLLVERAEFERRSEPLVRRCIASCEEAVQRAGLRWDQIDEILLVGSSTRMPMIRRSLESFGRPVRELKDPKGVVAKGAALWGYWLQQEMVRPEVLREGTSAEPTTTGLALPEVNGATAHGIGVLLWQGHDRWVDIIVPAHTQTPCEIERTYVTAVDNATVLEVPIYESDSNRPDDGVPIGTIVVDGLPPRPKGQPVKIYLKIDVSGILTVEVTDQETGRRVQKTIERTELTQRASQRLSLAERKARLDSLTIVD